jgi:nucleoside-diphosphate-sugar epimerase
MYTKILISKSITLLIIKLMQTILGANGVIAIELAKELANKYTKEIRLVSRNPKKVNETDLLFSADLLNAEQTDKAIEGSEIVYMTAGLPYDSAVWERDWPILIGNVIEACKKHKSKLVFFDNVYMYGQVVGIMDENTPFNSISRKGKARAQIAKKVLNAIENKEITALIARSPEFYGPKPTMSGTNATIFENIKKGKKLQVLIKDSTLRTLIFTPDASKATALLGNTPEAYGQTWHLPCDTNRLTTKQFIELCSELSGKDLKYMVMGKLMVKIIGFFVPFIKEVYELLYQWEQDYLFDCSKFTRKFPDFKITSLKEGIKIVLSES